MTLPKCWTDVAEPSNIIDKLQQKMIATHNGEITDKVHLLTTTIQKKYPGLSTQKHKRWLLGLNLRAPSWMWRSFLLLIVVAWKNFIPYTFKIMRNIKSMCKTIEILKYNEMSCSIDML